MDSLTAKIQSRGIAASVYNHLAWPSLAETAIQNYRSGRERTIILIGHSFGAGAAISIAERLGQVGIPVSLLVTFDPVVEPTIPANVKRAVNFYVSNGMGTPVARASNYRGALDNVDRKDLNHVSITTAPEIHRKVLGYVMQVVSSGARRPTPPDRQGIHAKNAKPEAETPAAGMAH
jgi:pimeloyl-ACP methyl ester carboxylesterase